MSKIDYEAPALQVIGTIHEVTQQVPNKCGESLDGYVLTAPDGTQSLGQGVPSDVNCTPLPD